MITILKPGFFTTIQDSGRYGFREFGVPISGCMDAYSADLANAVLGNDKNSAILEIALGNVKLSFDIQTIICISGGDFDSKLNAQSVALNRAINIHAGDELTFSYPRKGALAYLAVAGGIRSENSMGSRSLQKGITTVQRLEKGMKLALKSLVELDVKLGALAVVNPDHFTTQNLTVEPGPEFKAIQPLEQATLFNQAFSLSSNCNRIGFRLNERMRYKKLAPMLTGGVQPGTVQLTPSGNLIILMRDCQVTGGYPRVLQLTQESINRLAQKRPGDAIQFVKIDT